MADEGVPTAGQFLPASMYSGQESGLKPRWDSRYHVFWSRDFYAMMVVSMLAPVIPLGIEVLWGPFARSRQPANPPLGGRRNE